MAVVSRLQLDHPALGTTGGVALHTSIEALYQKIGDNMADRYFAISAFADSSTVDLDHNFTTDISNLRWDIYELSAGEWLRLDETTANKRSEFSIAEKVGDESDVLQITNNTGGLISDLAVVIVNDPLNLSEDDIKDIDITTTAPEEGQALVWDSASSKFIPGASGDASFKIQSVASDGTTVIKGGYLIDSLGREFATYDGAGSAPTDYGVDLTVDLDTIEAGAVNSTPYYLYIDMDAAVKDTLTNGRVLYRVVEGTLKLFTNSVETIDTDRYCPIGYVVRGVGIWSNSSFGSLAFRRHDAFSEEKSLNYIINPNAKRNATEGVIGTGGPSAARGSTAATFASNYFVITGFDGAGDEFEWSTDTLQSYHDNIMFKWSLSAKLNLTGSGVYTVGLWDGSAWVGDTATLIDGSIVNASGSFVFDSSVTYTIRIVSDASANALDEILVKDVKITNEGMVTGEASTPWTDYTPGTQGFGTISDDNVQYKQQGDSVAIMGYLTLGTVTANEAQIDLPTGMTIGGKGTGSIVVGYLDVDATQGAARSRRFQLIATKGDTFLNIGLDISDADENSMSPRNANSIFNSSSRITFSSAFIPIQELSGTQNIGENNVEYAYNTGTWDADDSSSFATGSGGQTIPTSTDLTTQRYKRVRFSSATDISELEVQLYVAGKWVNAASGVFHETGWITNAFMHGATGAVTASAGIGIRPVSGSDTDFDVYFGRYGNVYSSSFTTAWSAVISTNTVKWRVRKCSPGSPVGFGIATANNAGLVSSFDATTKQLASGLFTPTGTAGTNVSLDSDVDTYESSYMVVGDHVMIAGRVDCDPITTGTTTFTISLPPGLNSSTSGTSPLNGSGSGTVDSVKFYSASATTMTGQYNATTAGNQSFNYIVMYPLA